MKVTLSSHAKRIPENQTHGYIGQGKSKYKPPAKYEAGAIMRQYLYDRDRVCYPDLFEDRMNRNFYGNVELRLI